jgi:hypothetical protein
VKTLAIAALLVLSAFAALLLPAPIHLELYDVGDITYGGEDWGTSISLVTTAPSDDEDFYFLGEDLSNAIASLIPRSRDASSGSGMQFQNGLLIVRGSAAQQLAVRLCLGVTRAAVAIRNPVHALLKRAKTAICTAVYGMITA